MCNGKRSFITSLKTMTHFSQGWSFFFFFKLVVICQILIGTTGLNNMSTNFLKVPVTKFIYDQDVYYIDFHHLLFVKCMFLNFG